MGNIEYKIVPTVEYLYALYAASTPLVARVGIISTNLVLALIIIGEVIKKRVKECATIPSLHNIINSNNIKIIESPNILNKGRTTHDIN